MIKTEKEQKRVVYIASIPEWFCHTINDMFYRKTDWLFVPVQDLSPQERIKEYQKATYFVISGYGQKDEAIEAYKNGCILIGPRADVPSTIPVWETKAWDPIEVMLLLIIISNMHLGVIKNNFLRKIISFLNTILKCLYLVVKTIQTFKSTGLKTTITIIKHYFRKTRGSKI